jgi:hypothetical protein
MLFVKSYVLFMYGSILICLDEINTLIANSMILLNTFVSHSSTIQQHSIEEVTNFNVHLQLSSYLINHTMYVWWCLCDRIETLEAECLQS